MVITRRRLLSLLSAAVAQHLAPGAQTSKWKPAKRVVLITIGGVRRQESWSQAGPPLHPAPAQTTCFPSRCFIPTPSTRASRPTSTPSPASSPESGSTSMTGAARSLPTPPCSSNFKPRRHAAAGADLGGHQQQTAHRQHQSRRQRHPVQATDGGGGGANHHRAKLARAGWNGSRFSRNDRGARDRLRADRLGRALGIHLSRPDGEADVSLRTDRLHSRDRTHRSSGDELDLPDRPRSAAAHRAGPAHGQLLRRRSGPLRHLLAPPRRHPPHRHALSPHVAVHPVDARAAATAPRSSS